MSFPVFTAWWSPTTNPFAAPVWTQMVDSAGNNALRSYSVKRGKQKWLDRINAGTATITLRNRDGTFTPGNTTGINYPNVAPIKRVQIRATYNSTTYNRFTGWINTLGLTWNRDDSEITFQAYDIFGLLALCYCPAPYPVAVLADSPTAYYRMQEPTVGGGALAIDLSGNANHATYSATGVSSGSAAVGDTTAKSATFDGSLGQVTAPIVLSGTGAFSIELWMNGTAFGSIGNDTLVGDHQDDYDITVISGAIQFFVWGVGIAQANVNVADGKWHHIVATYDGTTARVYVDGTVGATTASGTGISRQSWPATFPSSLGLGPPPLWPGALAEVAFYVGSALSAARVTAHFQAAAAWLGMVSGTRISTVAGLVGVLAGDLNIDAGQSTLAKADDLPTTPALEHFLSVGASENGLVFANLAGQLRFIARQSLQVSPFSAPQATFGDKSDGSEIPYDLNGLMVPTDDIDIVNAYEITRKDGGTFAIQAAAATIALYGPPRKQKLTTLVATDTEAQASMQWDLTQSQTPAPRVESMTMTGHDANFAAIFARDLADLVTVNARPPGSSLLSQQVRVLGMSESVDATKRSFKAVWNLWPREPQVILLGDATWGTLNGPGVLGY